MSDIERGKKALEYFRNASLPYPAFKKMGFDTLAITVGGVNPTFFFDGLGFAINQIDMSESQVRDAMESLAYAAQGQIPQKTLFFQALSKRIQTITTGDIIKATPQIAADTAKDAVMGLKEVGDAVIDTGKSITVLGPIVVVAALIFIVYGRSRMIAGR